MGDDITVKFTALESARIPDLKALNRHGDGLNAGLDIKVLELISADSHLTMAEMTDMLNVTKRTVERIVRRLREDGHIMRKGGKRYGYWELM